MAAPHDIALAPDVDLWDGCTIRVTAIDPDTGNTVAGVKVSNVTLQVVQFAGDSADLTVGAWRLVSGPGA